jgi:predicted kinase
MVYMNKIIVVSGLPGTGKSLLSESLSQKLQIPIFSVDPIESAIIKSGFTRSFETGLAAYYVAESLAAEQLKLGHSVIIDAVSPVKESREMWYGLSKQFEAQLIIVECMISDKDTHKTRIKNRVRNLHGIPEVTWEDVETRSREYLRWAEDRIMVDTLKEHESNVNKVIEYIEKKSIA